MKFVKVVPNWQYLLAVAEEDVLHVVAEVAYAEHVTRRLQNKANLRIRG